MEVPSAHTHREGPYAPAVLRFHVSFPPGYPTLPPVITFFSDIFHPLVTPLTTYIYTTGSPSTDTVSATDEERLPPGGLNLRHGFPGWFGRGKKSIASSRVSSGNVSESLEAPIRNDASERKESGANAPFTASLSQEPQQPTGQTIKDSIQQPYGIFQVLNYVKRAFDSETLLDGLPSEAAGNPGAWKAWRAHRAQKTESSSSWLAAEKEVGGLRKEDKAMSPASQQDEWNWDGVWESRVRKGIDSSISDAVLFGRAGVVDDLVYFQMIPKSSFANTICSRLTSRI